MQVGSGWFIAVEVVLVKCAGDEASMLTHIFPCCEPNALASGVGSGCRSGVAWSSGILLMPDASANGSQA